MRREIALHALGLGAATGLRTMAAPTAVFGSALLATAALGEIVVDKLPNTPSRTGPVGLLARSTAAAFAAGTYARRNGGEADVAAAAVIGIAGALASAFAGRAYRAAAARANLPDVACALIEDVVAYTTAFSLVR